MDAPEPRSGDTNDFFLITAHEMRTSLSAMKWLFDMLEKGDFGTLTTEQHDVIKRACDTNERLIALVNDVMTVIKNDTADVQYIFAPCNLGHMITAAVKDFASAASHKHIHLSFSEPVQPILVSADQARLRVVIDNLIENAIKYGSNETGVTLSLTSDQTSATFSVQNSGIGIPQTDQDRIFQKFFRASNTSQHIGTGLGLYATKQIVERHKGTISFTGTEGVGAIFTITLPTVPHLV